MNDDVINALGEKDPELINDLIDYTDALQSVNLDFTPIIKAILRELPPAMELQAQTRANQRPFTRVLPSKPLRANRRSKEEVQKMYEDFRKRKRSDSDLGEARLRSNAGGSGGSGGSGSVSSR